MEDDDRCLVAFDTDDSEFTRGVEVGMVFERLSRGDRGLMMVHTSNAEMALRLADACGCTLRTVQDGDDFLWVEFV